MRLHVPLKALLEPDRLGIGSGFDARRGFVNVGSNVSINPNSVLLGAGGVKIRNDVRIASGAVVKGEAEPYGISGGIPARKIDTRLPAIKPDCMEA